MKQIVSDNEINFNDLEKEIYEIACKNARNLMTEILESMDETLQLNRDKKVYRHKGKRKTTIKTIMGEVEFKRTIYETTNDLDEKAYLYLLDQAIGLETFGKISTNLAANGQITGTNETKIIFEEDDGVWINMQGKDRPRKGRRSELKVAVAYDGWELEGKNRYKLRNKIAAEQFKVC